MSMSFFSFETFIGTALAFHLHMPAEILLMRKDHVHFKHRGGDEDFVNEM